MTGRTIARQFLAVFVGTAAAILLILQTGFVEHISYTIEKGRLRAIAETISMESAVDAQNESNRRIASLIRPAVVNIETVTYIPGDGGPLSELIDEHHPWRGQRTEDNQNTERPLMIQPGLGSGFVFDANRGYVMTNHHVIDGASRIDVRLADGRRYEAKVVAGDPDTDLAVLSIPSDRLFELQWGNSRQVCVGDAVFALGNPFGLEGTFSGGLVSALGRSAVISDIKYTGFIQTDAVINPGNSGGPLVNKHGEVIGVNTAIASDSGMFSGVGFAIPSDRVVALLPKLVTGQKIERGFLGVSALSIRDDRETADSIGWLEDYGVIVKSVVHNTPAEALGLKVNDIVVEVDGKRIGSFTEMMDIIALIDPGSRVEIRYWRDGQYLTGTVALVSRSDDF